MVCVKNTVKVLQLREHFVPQTRRGFAAGSHLGDFNPADPQLWTDRLTNPTVTTA